MSGYQVNEIFLSVQGEGMRAGTLNVFVRFSGCNMQCDMEPGPLSPGGFACDTEFVSGRKLTLEELVKEISETGALCRSVIFTGGEPGLQVDWDLAVALKEQGYYLAIETNGTIDVANLCLDWVACSPKVAEHALKLRHARELRYVRGYGQGIPRPVIQAEHKLLSPAFDSHELNPRTLQWVIGLIRANPDWRLSVQMHNLWKVR
jgi:7-carboxy-7-deazaguanine synthase